MSKRLAYPIRVSYTIVLLTVSLIAVLAQVRPVPKPNPNKTAPQKNPPAASTGILDPLQIPILPSIQPDPPKPQPPKPPAPPPIAKYSLTANPSVVGGNAPIAIDVDFSKQDASSSGFWFACEADFRPNTNWSAIGDRMREAGVQWLRVAPFDMQTNLPRFINGKMEWNEDTEKYLDAVAQSKINMILSLPTVPEWSDTDWETFATTAATLYGKGAHGKVIRWELAGHPDEILKRYALFVRIMRQKVPFRPVGVLVYTQDVTDAVQKIADYCTSQKLEINSFSWTLTHEKSSQIRVVMREFAKRPAHQRIQILPVLQNGFTTKQIAEVLDTETASKIYGCILPTTDRFRADGTLEHETARISLINRIARTFQPTGRTNSGIQYRINAKSKSLQLLIWSEESSLTNLQPLTIRLRNAPMAGMSILRESSYSDTDSMVRIPLTNVRIPKVGADVSLVVEPGEATLLTLTPTALPPFSLAVSAVKSEWYVGQDIELDVRVQNLSNVRRNVEVQLVGGGVVTPLGLKANLGNAGQDERKQARFKTTLKGGGREGQRFILVRVGKNVGYAVGVFIQTPFTLKMPSVNGASPSSRIDMKLPGGFAELPLEISPRILDRTFDVNLNHAFSTTKKVAGQNLQFNSATTAVLQIPSPSRDAGVYGLDVFAETLNDVWLRKTFYIGVPHLCVYAKTPIQVDGDLSEWANALPMGMGRQEQTYGKAWQGPADLSGYGFVRWNEQFFYVACAVNDDQRSLGDSIEFVLITDPTRYGEQGNGVQGVAHFRMSVLENNKITLLRRTENGWNEVDATTMQLGSRSEGNRTFYELGLPWKEVLGAEQQVGQTFGYSLLINDMDKERFGTIAWSEGLHPYFRAKWIPPILLVK